MIIQQGTMTTVEETTNKIRFKMQDGKCILQQLHSIVTFDSGGVFKRDMVWRDVECVGPDAPDVET